MSGGAGDRLRFLRSAGGITFKEIDFRRRDPVQPNDAEALSKPYKVFSTDKESVDVMAGSATEAIEKSGITNPVRVVREDLTRPAVLDHSFFKTPAAPASAETPAAVPPAVETPTAATEEAPAPEAPEAAEPPPAPEGEGKA